MRDKPTLKKGLKCEECGYFEREKGKLGFCYRLDSIIISGENCIADEEE